MSSATRAAGIPKNHEKLRGPRMVLLAAAVLGVGPLIGCGSGDTSAESATTVSSTAATSTSALVGTWTRTTTCDEFVERQTRAGFTDDLAENVVGNGWLPEVSAPEAIADPTRLCAGAVAREHSHFFTDNGEFGSLDWNGDQVDDGTYELVDNDTFTIPYVFDDESIEMVFDFRIDGDSITFDPQLPDDCKSAHCREAASWAVAVAYDGLSWERS